MASTIIIYEGDGTKTDFTVPFDYLKKSFVTVRLGTGTTLTGGDYGDTGSDYYFLDKTTIRLKVAPASGESLTIRRYTSATERVVTFKDASILKATDLDTSQMQAFHIAEEGRDILDDSLSVNREGNWDAKGKRIINVGTPVADSDAVTYGVYKTDAKGAYQSKLDAERARDRAVEAETNSKKSEENAKLSAVNAQASAGTAVSASKNADAAKVENQAILQEAKEIRDENKVLDANTKDNANVAQVKANEAKVSETNAKASEVEAKKQADLAKQYAGQTVAGQVQADWAETDTTSKAFIKNKPTLGALASKDSIAYSEITGTPPEQDLSGLATKEELQTGLASKANTNHTHPISQIPNLQASLDAKTNDATLQVDLTAIRESITNVSSKVEGIPTPKAYVTETWRSGEQWQRRWSDGWLEQGGRINLRVWTGGRDPNRTFSLPTAFSNATYTTVATGENGYGWATLKIISQTTSSVTVAGTGASTDDYVDYVHFYCSGY